MKATITALERNPVAFDSRDLARRFRLVVVIDLEVIQQKGKVELAREQVRGEAYYSAPRGITGTQVAEDEAIGRALRDLAEIVRYPLAIRSSSLLEDSQHQPFAGVYETYMLSNSHRRSDRRLEDLCTAVKLVYASTFSAKAKAYLRATPHRPEKEKMAVIIQKIVGGIHGNRFYPDFSGIIRSHNFYPTGPMKCEDGIAAVALGLGKTVVEGEACLRFSPIYPQHPVQFSSVENSRMWLVCKLRPCFHTSIRSLLKSAKTKKS